MPLEATQFPLPRPACMCFHHVQLNVSIIRIPHYTTNAVLRSDRIELLKILIPGPSYIAALVLGLPPLDTQSLPFPVLHDNS
jgi:hypothetical protein